MNRVEVFGPEGRIGDISLSLDLVKKETSPATYARAIRVLRQGWRQGTVASKSRGQLAFSNKKPWKQKGTGRARASSLRSPLWRKGGIIFGPQPRTRKLGISRKARSYVMNNVFFAVADQGNIRCLEFSPPKGQPSTKLAVKSLKNAGISSEKTTLFLSFNDHLMAASFRNIPNVQVVFYDQPNAFDLSSSSHWAFLKKDADEFKKMVERWN